SFSRRDIFRASCRLRSDPPAGRSSSLSTEMSSPLQRIPSSQNSQQMSARTRSHGYVVHDELSAYRTRYPNCYYVKYWSMERTNSERTSTRGPVHTCQRADQCTGAHTPARSSHATRLANEQSYVYLPVARRD